MQFSLATITALLSLTSAAAITARSPTTGRLVSRQASVCGALATPVCCQLDILGVANLNCENAGPVETTEDFTALCAETGTSAQCCALPLGTDSLLCTAA
ncbi:uncharacterized protein EKO05_0005646 [Ascochyta rabiei]|uniref:Extracellular region n=1 Tax=Didymella rabiei TaxID=5454 RepID=A0A163FFY5_DIDRA|nr:uncharacterized protein EKO05_0005646 [Ascochyta rabiei]KZM24336.1 extracellular region [Ascochyta rabiei]UPX15189.1 hypothetical protein EKO05_0005646 [Ascochyta rabiei]